MIVEIIIMSIVTVILAVILLFVVRIHHIAKEMWRQTGIWQLQFNLIENRTLVTQKFAENNTMLLKDLDIKLIKKDTESYLDDGVESKIDDLYKNPDGVYSRKAYLANTNSTKS